MATEGRVSVLLCRRFYKSYCIHLHPKTTVMTKNNKTYGGHDDDGLVRLNFKFHSPVSTTLKLPQFFSKPIRKGKATVELYPRRKNVISFAWNENQGNPGTGTDAVFYAFFFIFTRGGEKKIRDEEEANDCIAIIHFLPRFEKREENFLISFLSFLKIIFSV